MTRLGFIGVGPHAQKMAQAFRECGAEVVAFSRSPRHLDYANDCCRPDAFRDVPFMGTLEQITSPDIDALIICAPPEVTTEVALACAKAGKRCVATKPLMWTEPPFTDEWAIDEGIRRGMGSASGELTPRRLVYVDLWRLYSPAWHALKAGLQGKQIERVRIEFTGNGPVRSFSGALDYGPHALAFLHDLLGPCAPREKYGTVFDGPKRGVGIWTLQNESPVPWECVFGNGASEPVMRVTVTAAGEARRWIEAPGALVTTGWQQAYYCGDEQYAARSPSLTNQKSLALHAFCRAFLSGAASDTLRLSCEGMKVLESCRPAWSKE